MSLQFQQPLVGKRLRELRERLGLTRAELSTLTGVTTSAIVRLESGLDVRLSSYLPIVQYFAAREPLLEVLVQRLVLLPDARRAELMAIVDAAEPEHD